MAERTPRRIIVTGATGLIGPEIVRRLAGRGDLVTAFVRNVEQARKEIPQAAAFVRWSDEMSEGEWTDAVEVADGIIHLAGSPIGVRWSEGVKRKAYDSRINGTRHIVKALARPGNRGRVLVSASAVGYYGVAPGGKLTESSPAGDDFLARLCVDWEREARRAEEHGTRVAIVRTGIACSPKGGALAKLLTPFRLFVGGPLGSGKQPFPWIHIADEAEIFIWAFDNGDVSGPLNGTAPGVVTNEEFARVLGRVMGRPAWFPVPEFVLRIILGEGSSVVTEGQFALPERVRELGFRFSHPEVEGALRDLLADR